ncbi:MAG: MFS transporter, partial [Phycisphaerales bacterium]|nr:MFS transporter [Phycisphaerales bacterium]
MPCRPGLRLQRPPYHRFHDQLRRRRMNPPSVASSGASAPPATPASPASPANTTALPILFAISGAHLLNDTIQSLLPAIYPILKEELAINFTQVGLITLAFQLTASILQPFIGFYTDRRPQPFSLATGMVFTLAGVALL